MPSPPIAGTKHASRLLMPGWYSPALRRFAFFAFALADLQMLGAGLVYATTRRMLPYHEQAIGLSWTTMTPGFQALYLMMCRAIGVATVIAALALLAMLLIPFRRGETWALRALATLSLGYGLPMLGIAIWVRLQTGAQTPVAFLAIGSVLGGLGAVVSVIDRTLARRRISREACAP